MISIPYAWRNNRSALAGSFCNACKLTWYPSSKACPACRNSTNPVELSGKGTIVSITTVHESSMPFMLAIIKLDEGPQVTAQIVDTPAAAIGSKVVACLRRMQSDGAQGIIQYGIKFRGV
ncbi:MAG TPA: OB-fold domain-containing protein [Candidatus Nanoarchaeia archaeon]|nr:OB-fold domain-containing protein [Candidatus Nanoarchaeia archaeon]